MDDDLTRSRLAAVRLLVRLLARDDLDAEEQRFVLGLFRIVAYVWSSRHAALRAFTDESGSGGLLLSTGEKVYLFDAPKVEARRERRLRRLRRWLKEALRG